MADYAARQLATQLNLPLPVHLLSVVGADAALCDQWLEEALMPLVEKHREEAAAALKRKVGGLREAVVSVLESRLQGDSLAPPAPRGPRVQEAVAALRIADALLEAAQRDGEEIMDGFSTLADDVLDAAATDLTAVWISVQGKNAEVAKTLSASVHRVLAGQVTKLLVRLVSVRSQLDQALQLAQQVLPPTKESSEQLPMPAGAPLADTTTLAQNLVLKRPVLLSSLGAAVLRRHTRSRLEEQLRETLPELLKPYRQQVGRWFTQSLAELRTAFAARAGLLRAQFEARAATPTAEPDAPSVAADLRQLCEWRKQKR